MPKNTSFSLSDHYVEFIHDQVDSGRYGSASEVVREGLRLLENREAKLRALREALIEGEESGEAVEFDIEGFLAEMKARRG